MTFDEHQAVLLDQQESEHVTFQREQGWLNVKKINENSK